MFAVDFEGQTRMAPVGNIQSIHFAENNILEEEETPVPASPVVLKSPPAVQGQEQPLNSDFSSDIQLSTHGYDEKVSISYHEVLRMLKKGGMKLVTVDIQVKNNSKETIQVSWYTFKLQTQDGTICDATAYAPEVGQLGNTTVRPGDKAKGKIGFEVPIGVIMHRSFVRYDFHGSGDSPKKYSDWFPIH